MFAIQANLSEIREQRQRGSWEFALQRARDAQTYTSLYFRKLKAVPLTPQEEVTHRNTNYRQQLLLMSMKISNQQNIYIYIFTSQLDK